jgi:D-glycero-D-manno-heptose 1,7-bisphosphate phosphatase
MSSALRRAVFLDRDGVLIEDKGLLVDPAEMRILPGAFEATRKLSDAGFALVAVTNQPVIARGLATEQVIAEIHVRLAACIEAEGGGSIAGFYFCPHHPNADLPEYRIDCDCRKPRPGLLLEAAADLRLDLRRSVMVGDRMTDVAAGARAGCCTVLVRTGAHLQPEIQTPDPVDPQLEADHACDDLASAAVWILTNT